MTDKHQSLLATHDHNQLEPIEKASVDELRSIQLERLRSSLHHAYKNSQFYKQKFDDLGIHPDDLTSLDDLAKFPLTVKSDLRDNYPFGMLARPMDDVVRVHASSGTTGKPTVVAYTQNDIDTWANVVARSIRAAGGQRSDMIHIAYGYGLFTGGLGAHYGAEKLGCTVIPMSGGQTQKQVQLIQDFNPDIIMVTPSYMLNIADEMERQGVDPHQLKLRTGIFGAEPWTNSMRTELEQRLGIDAVDIYGLSEVMGPGVAMECLESKDGPTIWEDHFYPEIINPETGEVLPDGEEGELVFTSLTKEALPIIRYRTRDLTRLLPGTSRPMRRMDKITGRSDDMLIIRGVNVFPTQIEEQILTIEALSPHYQIEISRTVNLDSMQVNIESKQGLSELQSEAASKELQYKIKTMIGVSTKVKVHKPNSIPRSEGKAQRVIDSRLTPIFNKSFERCLSKEGFIDKFYTIFISASDDAKTMFKSTDMNSQKKMLQTSLHMMMTAPSGIERSNTHIELMGKTHSRSGYGIKPELYDLWLDCLLKTVKDYDESYDNTIESAWKNTLQYGIDIMKSMY
ncbi:MAG: phenylacetate-CoA ligase [Kiritimatiellia bacterium]|jgi:phenylacetate-CoA ligase